MFMGEYNHTIDAKGRLIIPSRFRELLGEEFVLTRGLDGCLSIYPMDEWVAFEEKLRALPLTNKDARTFSRFFVAGATTCQLDKQGRILVPQTLRQFAGLDKDVVLTGNLNRIEVWSKELALLLHSQSGALVMLLTAGFAASQLRDTAHTLPRKHYG